MGEVDKTPAQPSSNEYLSDIDLRELIRAYEAQRNPTPLFSEYVIVCLKELQAIRGERPIPRLNGRGIEHKCPLCKEKLLTIIPPDLLRGAHETSAPPVNDRFSACYDAFSIGSAVRSPQVLLANIENSKRRSDCLSAIEREFFTYVVADEDGEDMERCDLSWGADPDEYVEQFRAALAKRASPENGRD